MINLKKNFIGVKLICNVVLISGVQQSEPVIHIHKYTLFFRFFSHWSHYRVLINYCFNSFGWFASLQQITRHFLSSSFSLLAVSPARESVCAHVYVCVGVGVGGWVREWVHKILFHVIA